MPSLPFIGELHPTLVAWGLGVSVLIFVAGLALVPLLVVRMGEDYFVRSATERHERSADQGVAALLGKLLKNALGAVLVLLGIAMLVLPGQGILTILAGLGLLTFPGKRRLELRLLRMRAVRRVVDALRTRAGKPPLILD